MKKTMTSLLGGIAVAAVASGASAEDMANLVINGETQITTHAEPVAGSPLSEVLSGWTFRSEETQALEMDDFENPAFPAVDHGLDLWTTADGSEGKSCADCHGAIEDGMKGVRASMPKINDEGTLWTMEENINNCRTTRMGAEAWKWESGDMLAMTAAIGLQSRGMPVNVAVDGDAASWFERGKEIYYTRVGQLDMACSNCHEDNYGNHIRADHLSQGQINGFPTYRLKWGGLGSIHRRFKGCMKNIRAKPFKVGSDEFKSLELYLAWRGTGLSVETPAVRN